MKLLLLACLLTFVSCDKDKDEDNKYKDYVCFYGVHKARLQRELIGCWHREIAGVGTNQSAADAIAEHYNIPKVDVSIVANYKDYERIEGKNCNCD